MATACSYNKKAGSFYCHAGPVKGPALLLLGLLALCLAGGAARAQDPLPTVELTVGTTHNIQAELAQTPETRTQGLMGRLGLAQDRGMLFAFDTQQPYCFWMKNTLLPLSIAFIDPQGRIVSIQDMQPRTLDTHCAPQPVLYALEMNQGWFQSAGVGVGDIVGPLPPPGR
ncbi:MAG TPA: DUF192 domain-containing protein [Castellaniella sp.]|nr:DUF192 domain-containing protein [Castellaniella sp.]